jgi:hypothetical protein
MIDWTINWKINNIFEDTVPISALDDYSLICEINTRVRKFNPDFRRISIGLYLSGPTWTSARCGYHIASQQSMVDDIWH